MASRALAVLFFVDLLPAAGISAPFSEKARVHGRGPRPPAGQTAAASGAAAEQGSCRRCCLLAGAAVTAKFESVRLSRCRGACLPVTWLLSPCRLTRCGRSFGASCMGICLRLSVCLSHVSVRFKCVQRSCVDEKTCVTAAVVGLVARVAKLSCPHGPHSCRMHEFGRDVADLFPSLPEGPSAFVRLAETNRTSSAPVVMIHRCAPLPDAPATRLRHALAVVHARAAAHRRRTWRDTWPPCSRRTAAPRRRPSKHRRTHGWVRAPSPSRFVRSVCLSVPSFLPHARSFAHCDFLSHTHSLTLELSNSMNIFMNMFVCLFIYLCIRVTECPRRHTY